MNLTKLLIYMSLSITYFSFGQNESVEQWKNAHVSVLLIEQNDATPDFIKMLALKNQEYIIYQNELSEIDIQNYNLQKGKSISSLTKEEKDEIKIWKATHPNVLIISQEDFNKMPEEKKNAILQQEVIIFQGEELVLTEIYAYDEK